MPSRLEVQGENGLMLMEIKRAAQLSLVLPSSADAERVRYGARDALERLVRG